MHILSPFVLTTSLILVSSVLSGNASAVTYYLSPTGSDSSSGTSSASPWKTFSFAFPKLQPGDTLILKDGTYNGSNSGYPYINCVAFNYKNGTASAPITIKAENERQAFIKGDGSREPFILYGCQYWVVQGLRVENGDFQNQGSVGLEKGAVLIIVNAQNITVKRNLVRFNNRYYNAHALDSAYSSNSLFEENEVYSFHRHGLFLYYCTNNVVRRNYINSRGYADIPGGYNSDPGSKGDGGVVLYPASDNIVENNIAEGVERGVLVNTARSQGNKLYGNIGLNDDYGGLLSGTNTTSVDFASINSRAYGFIITGQGGNHSQMHALGSVNDGYQISNDNGPGATNAGGTCSQTITNAMAAAPNLGVGYYGFIINTTQTSPCTYTMSYPNANGYPVAYKPSVPNASTDHALTASPNMGSCYVFIPSTSPMKGAGAGGKDIGANILYRYQDGILTNQPLWDSTTGAFPCGAIVAGVNDIAGSSCFDVHKRLNVNTNGCSLPVGYSQQPPQPAPQPPQTPTNLQVSGQ